MTLIGQNTYLIVSISSPHILTAAQQTSKALSCWKHRGFARDLSCPFPTEKPQLWRARNKAGTFIQHHCCLSPYIQLGSAEQNRADVCPHGTAVPRTMAGPAPSASSFILQRWHSDLLWGERSDKYSWPCRTKHSGGQSWWQFKWHSK